LDEKILMANRSVKTGDVIAGTNPDDYAPRQLGLRLPRESLALSYESIAWL